MTTNINSAIYNTLSGCGTVYPVIALNQESLPFIVYHRSGFRPSYSKNLFTGEIDHGYEVLVADTDYTNSLTLAEAVINAMLALTSRQPENAGYRFCQVTLDDMSESYYDDGFYVQSLNFTIKTKEN